MKEIFKVLKRYIPPYKKMLLLSLIFTFVSAILNVFSFMIIIPILQILFKIEDTSNVTFIQWSEMNSDNIQEVAINNANYYLNTFMDDDKIEDIYLYFKEDAESDSLEEAVEELGSDYTEEEIRLVRIKFMCEAGN